MEISKVQYVRVELKDMRRAPAGPKHFSAQVVIVDKTQGDGVRPMVYQLADDAVHLLEDENFNNNHLLHNDAETFSLIGELISIDRAKKMIRLCDELTISYQHLIIASGDILSSREDHTAEFIAGLRALADALRIQRKVGAPIEPATAAGRPMGEKCPTTSNPTISVRNTPVFGVERAVYSSILKDLPDPLTMVISPSGKRLFEVQV